MADNNFMQQKDGIETGYFSKRKAKFNQAIADGINSVGVPATVQNKKKHSTNESKPLKTEKPKAKKLPETKVAPRPPKVEKKTESEYRKQVLDNGRVMHFKGNTLVSKDEYEKNAK